jgi:hypothetical protein
MTYALGRRHMMLVVTVVCLLLAVITGLVGMMHLSAEDNLTECAYEAERLLINMSAENTDVKVKKRSNLVFACMKARRFEFDFEAYGKVASTTRLSGAEDDLRKDTFISIAPSFWKRNWGRYWVL